MEPKSRLMMSQYQNPLPSLYYILYSDITNKNIARENIDIAVEEIGAY